MTRAAVFVGAVVLAWLIWDTEADPVRLAHGLPWILDFVRRMIPPDLGVLPAALAGAVKTVEIALLGTAVAAILALPLGFLSARNIAAGAVFYPARAVLNFFRSVDTLVYALVFVAAVGLGPFPGVLAVVAYTTTSLAKLYSEAIEGIEPGPVDAITATGATRLQILRFGVLPQVLPLFLSYVLYRLETNIRAATVLGFVGAGGIGFYLQTYLRKTSLAKLYSEAIEGIEPGPVDAITATGATRLQILRFGVLPQVLPLFLSYVLYRLETNIRAATVLGFVGAGGIGFYLQTYLRMIDYPAASTVLLVTVVMVMVVDAVSSRLRARLV